MMIVIAPNICSRGKEDGAFRLEADEVSEELEVADDAEAPDVLVPEDDASEVIFGRSLEASEEIDNEKINDGDGVVATPKVDENEKLFPSNVRPVAAEVVAASPIPNGADWAQKDCLSVQLPCATM